MMLNEKQIEENWNTFRDIINTTFIGERKDKLNEMYDYFEERIVLAPASGREHFHNAFPGGYVDHVLRVIDLSKKFLTLWQGETEVDFTEEELIFSAMHHDLGKLGDLTGDYYVPNESQWHREKQGLIYGFNPEIYHMTIADRTFFLLNHFGIKYNQNEMLAIKNADGLFEDDNETYLKQSNPDRQIKTEIVFVIHQADITATRIEWGRWRRSKTLTNKIQPTEVSPVVFKKKDIGRISNIVEKNQQKDNKQQLFEDLFK